jgi:cell division protein FtsZ
VLNAFKMADEVLLQGVSGITGLITTPGLINTDFADVKMVLVQCRLGADGHRPGQRRRPCGVGCQGRDLAARCSSRRSTAHAASCSTSPVRPAMGLFEMNAAAEIIHGVAHQDANIIFGTVIDDEMGDEVRITVIAAGFDRLDDSAPLRSTTSDDGPRTTSTRITELFGPEDDEDPLADDGDDDDFDVPSFLK